MLLPFQHFSYICLKIPGDVIEAPVTRTPAQEALQRVCGAFLCAVEQYQALVPKAFCDKTLPDIKKALLAWIMGLKKSSFWFGGTNNIHAMGAQKRYSVTVSFYFQHFNCYFKTRFMMRHADSDLTLLFSGSVPPMDISKLSIFSSHVAKYNGEARGLNIISQGKMLLNKFF